MLPRAGDLYNPVSKHLIWVVVASRVIIAGSHSDPWEVTHPGLVLVVTDNPLHPDRRSGKDFVIMSSA